MESPAASCSVGAPVVYSAASPEQKEREELFSQVDPFLLEVLVNPRHRLTGSYPLLLLFLRIWNLALGLGFTILAGGLRGSETRLLRRL
ncbi:hypothetical protein GW17_00029596 [Ensete ventricosum]|nr:hypothetical protein GW17_00029596 [Ensete ventricosum]